MTKCLLAREGINANKHVVEAAGIEPASLKGEASLLRAQLMMALFLVLALTSARRQQTQYQ